MTRLKNLYHSLWFKMVGAFVVLLFALMVALVVLVTAVTQRAFREYIAGRSAVIQNVVPTLVVPQTPVLPTAPPRPSRPPRPTRVRGEVQGTDTTIIGDMPNVQPINQDEPAESIEIIRIIEPEPVISEIINAVIPTETEAVGLQFLRDVQRGLLLAVLFTFMVALVMGTILTRQITRPLSQLRQATQNLAEGDLTVRVPVSSKDEVGKVSNSFNQMAAQLEKQERLRRQMVADVAHELRTPLTVMKSNLEAMQDGLLLPNGQEIGELQGEVERLSRLIEDLRLLSLADAGQLTLQLTPVEVNALLSLIAARYQPLAAARSIKIVSQPAAAPLWVKGDADRLQQALGNLLDNAIRYTPPSGKVTVTAVLDSQSVHLSVADTGPGIPEAELAYLFDRFWRGDKSRSRDSGGSGLGLAIVNQIVSLHQGRLQVVSAAEGAIFTISLPLFERA